MPLIPATITTEVLEHTDGRPIAYVDATAVAVFAYQEPSGTHVIDIRTRDDIPSGRLRIQLDGEALDAVTTPAAAPVRTHGYRGRPEPQAHTVS